MESFHAIRQALINDSNDFSRATLTALVSWFTVFITVNYLAIGWIATATLKNQVYTLFPVVLLCLVFVSQNALGVYVCLITRRWFGRASEQVSEMCSESKVVPAFLFPHGVYMKATLAMVVAQILLAMAWGGLLWYSICYMHK